MSAHIHVIAYQVFQKDSLEECTLEEIKQLTAKYPYFAPAQVLLVQKMAQIGHPDYADQLQKAVLYYPDPLQFELLIHPERFHSENRIEEFIPVTPSPEEEETDTKLPAVEPVPEPMEPAASITFEPYHTIDYFASQGIKISDEDAGKDRFGKQLKSFTEWLRSMKRAPPVATFPIAETSQEKTVQHLAESSLESTNVYTEAMAEIWERQGNVEKASEIYKELTLRDPSKKAYFAAKIEKLKA